MLERFYKIFPDKGERDRATLALSLLLTSELLAMRMGSGGDPGCVANPKAERQGSSTSCAPWITPRVSLATSTQFRPSPG